MDKLQAVIKKAKEERAKGGRFQNGGRGGRGGRRFVYRPPEEWKKVPPKEGEPKTKQKNGKTYYWCEDHQLWCLHKPEDCTLKQQREKDSDDNNKENQANNANTEDDELDAIMDIIEQEEGGSKK